MGAFHEHSAFNLLVGGTTQLHPKQHNQHHPILSRSPAESTFLIPGFQWGILSNPRGVGASAGIPSPAIKEFGT